MSRPRLIALLLALATLLVYLPVGTFQFVDFDDTDYVTANPMVNHGLTWAGVKWAFTCFHAGNWHPLTWISLMADCSLFGLNAGALHFVNALFHAGNVALVFLLLWRLTAKIGPSALVAALFAWHPLHVESVAWISERKDVLSTFFGLLMLLSYARYARANDRRSLWIALLFFALGLMAKPMLVTFPFVLLLLDYWPLGRLVSFKSFQALVVEKLPFFLLTVISCVVTFFAQQAGEAVMSLTKVPLSYRFENALVAVVGYLQKLFWPSGLCILYPLPKTISGLHVAMAGALLFLVSAVAWRGRHSKPYCLIGWLWFLGTLVPVIGLVQVGDQAMADRYAYIPSIGLFMALVFLANELADQLKTPDIIRFGGAGLIGCACILGLEKQLPYWRNSETLFRRAVAVTPHNNTALVNLGVALDAQGKFEEALTVYHEAERDGSRLYQLHNNIGNVLGLLGRHAESLAEYQQAIRLQPQNAILHNAAGRELAALGQFDGALEEFKTAEQLDPNYAAPHLEAAKVLFKMGADNAGLSEFHRALELAPNNYQTLATIAHYLAANANVADRNGQAALALALKADVLSGHVQPVVQDYLGMAYAENGDFSNAILCAQNAINLAAAARMNDLRPFQKRLALYQRHQPWRESFASPNIPGNGPASGGAK